MKITKLETFLYAVKKRMSENFLLLNTDKTEMLVIGSACQRRHCDQVTVTRSKLISLSSNVMNLGFTFDSTLSFDQHTGRHMLIFCF